MHLALAEAAALLVAADREPELDQMRAVARQHALELRRLPDKFGVFLIRTESHHPLDTGPVVPGTIKQHDLAIGRQMLYVTLEIPLAALEIGRLLQRDDARTAWIQVFHETLDGAPLARRIAALEEDHHLLSGVLDPGLQFQQLDLQAVFLPLVIAALHQVAVRVAAFAPIRQQLVIRIRRQLVSNHALLLEQSLEHGHRSEEHTSELQSHHDLVCRLLLEKKKKKK